METYMLGIMALSVVVDVCLLVGSGRLTFDKMYIPGMIAASLVGALYKACCMVPVLSGWNHLVIRLFILAVMGILTFGWSRNAARPVVTFLVLQMALAGLISGAGKGSVWSILAGFAALLLLCVFGYRQVGSRIIPAELTNDGNTVKIRALVDTGNLLKDPLTGESVLVVCNKLGVILAGLTENQIADPVQTLLDKPNLRLRLLPYHTVGQKNGMMLAMKIDNVKLRGKNAGKLIAFAPYGLGMQKDYQALVGGM